MSSSTLFPSSLQLALILSPEWLSATDLSCSPQGCPSRALCWNSQCENQTYVSILDIHENHITLVSLEEWGINGGGGYKEIGLTKTSCLLLLCLKRTRSFCMWNPDSVSVSLAASKTSELERLLLADTLFASFILNLWQNIRIHKEASSTQRLFKHVFFAYSRPPPRGSPAVRQGESTGFVCESWTCLQRVRWYAQRGS